MLPDLAATGMGQLRETRGLDEDHRQNARHEVEDQPAREGEGQRKPEPDVPAFGGHDEADRRARRGLRADSSDQRGSRRRRQFGGAGDAALTPCQDADRGWLGQLVIRRPRQSDLDRPALSGHRLCCGVVDQRGRIGKEAQLGRVGGESRYAEREAFALRLEPSELAMRPRQGGERPGNPLLRTRIGDALGCDRQVEREAAFLGDTDLVADEPGRLRLESERLARPRRLRNGDRDRQNHAVLEAEVHQRLEREGLRGRPGDRPRARSTRERPLDAGRFAGIAGVAPVGMPARGDLLVECDVELLARLHRVALGDKRGSDARGYSRGRLRGDRCRHRQSERERGGPRQPYHAFDCRRQRHRSARHHT